MHWYYYNARWINKLKLDQQTGGAKMSWETPTESNWLVCPITTQCSWFCFQFTASFIGGDDDTDWSSNLIKFNKFFAVNIIYSVRDNKSPYSLNRASLWVSHNALFGNPRHTQPMIAYIILNEYFWKFQWKIALWECCWHALLWCDRLFIAKPHKFPDFLIFLYLGIRLKIQKRMF